MNVSLNWLKDYLKIDQSTEEICKILTSIELEVGGSKPGMGRLSGSDLCSQYE